CLRAILRQDPDVIMVGEIRDLETAQIAIESALTGHLVLSTLHTNDAPSAVTRLVDMDVEPFLVTSSVVGVLAQRLVRTICPNCRDEYRPKEDLFYDLGLSSDDIKGVTFTRGRGCAECNYVGYRGRIGIFELFQLSEHLREMILKREPSSVIRRQARLEGMRTMREEGWTKIKMGLTTVEEVLRETT
ncbi:MAG TPA: ATPase, T2SS/T4P/T4SS family, partial [bacterium]|nr:ATPase, T2SS/T4P/T4SS family [bacterium]